MKAVGRIIIFILRPCYWFISWNWSVVTFYTSICLGWGGGGWFLPTHTCPAVHHTAKEANFDCPCGSTLPAPESSTHCVRGSSLPHLLGGSPIYTVRRLHSFLTVLEAQLWVPAGSNLTLQRLNHYCLEVQFRPSGGSTLTVWMLNSDFLDAQLWSSGGLTLIVWRLNSDSLEAQLLVVRRLNSDGLEDQLRLSFGSILTVWRPNSDRLEA